MQLTIGQQEDLRVACLEFLVIRYPNAYRADAIGRMLTRRQRIDFNVLSSEVTAALTFLLEEGFSVRIFDSLAMVPSWQATSKGVSHYQRKRVEENPAEGEV